MKYQSYYPYHFHNHFDSPLLDFMKDPKNAEMVNELMGKWLENNIRSRRTNGSERDLGFEMIRSIQFGFPGEGKKDGFYLSGIYLLASRIIDLLTTRIQDCGIDTDVVIRILLGLMVHEYYTTGEYGEKLWDLLDEEFAQQEKGTLPRDKSLLALRTKLIPFYTESTSLSREKSHEVLYWFFQDLVSGKNPKADTEEIKAALKTSVFEPELFKFTKEGLDIAAARFPDRPDIIKGLKQNRIKRKGTFRLSPLLIAVISAIYQEEELFLYFDPYYFEMGVCDRKHLQVKSDHINLVMSFTNILHTIFCKHCIKSVFGKYDIDFSTLTPKETSDVLKEMLDDLYNQLAKVCPDDVTVTVEGKVKDMNKYTEVDEALPYGKVGFDKHNGKKTAVNFKVEKNLKSYKKKVE